MNIVKNTGVQDTPIDVPVTKEETVQTGIIPDGTTDVIGNTEINIVNPGAQKTSFFEHGNGNIDF